MTSRAWWNRQRIWDMAASLAVVAALTVCFLAVRRVLMEHSDAVAIRASQQGRKVDNWSYLIGIGHSIGQATAPIRLVEFADFECPACARAELILDSAQRDAKIPFRIMFVQFPLTAIHSDAFAAGVAAECAARQSHFEQIHHAFYRQQSAIGRRPWTTFAIEAGVSDTASFNRCLSDSTAAGAVRQQSAVAARLGLIATPTFIADGIMYPPGTPVGRILTSMGGTP